MAHELLSQSRKLNEWRGGPNKSRGDRGGLENFLKKDRWGRDAY